MVTVRGSRDGRELVFFDGVENVYTRIAVTDPTGFTEADVDDFPVPVDDAGTLRTAMVELRSVPAITIRDETGRVIDPAVGGRSLDSGRYLIEVFTPIKLFLWLDGPVHVRSDRHRCRLAFGSRRQVRIGVRTPNVRPRSTVVATRSVSDVFAAVSTFGSAMRTFGPERSFPSMRGHPPLVEFGEKRHIPSSAAPPDTDICLELPGSYEHAAIAAPLAYYLGARLRASPGPPRLLVGEEELVRLDTDRMASDCADLLHRTLLLDCLSRASGGSNAIVHERTLVEEELDTDWGELRALTPGERLGAYLDVPTDLVRRVLPPWHQRAFVLPNPRTIETLPYLAYDLMCVHPARSMLARGAETPAPLATDGGALVRRSSPGARRPPRNRSTIGSVGRDTPIGLNPAYPASYRNRLARDGTHGTISIALVCNDAKMAEELEFADSAYASRDRAPVSVDRYENVSTSELAGVFADRIDYLHYIGHIDERGFECRDGSLDTASLEAVGVELFFLNACHSMTQATSLVESGAVGGIVTQHAIVNSGAVRLGQRIAELLIHGFPVGGALELARSDSPMGHKYTIIGDPKLDIAQAPSGVPYRCELTPCEGDRYRLTVMTHLTATARQGSAASFRLDEETPYYLNPTRRSFVVGWEELTHFLDLEDVPVRYDGRLFWSTQWREALGEEPGDPDRSR